MIHNARIYTMDERMPLANVAVLRGGRFVDVGVEENFDIMARRHGKAKMVDLQGLTVLPGLHDSHLHIHHLGSSYLNVQLQGAKSLDEVRGRIRRYLENPPKAFDRGKQWVIGMGWDQTVIADLHGRFPTAADLDADTILASVPILLYRVDIHASWLNGRALKLVSAEYPLLFAKGGQAIEGGEIARLPDGSPSGVLIDKAMRLAEGVKPKPGKDWDAEAVKVAGEKMVQVGLTTVQDASATPRFLELYKSAIDAGTLPLRVYAMLHCEDGSTYCGDDFDQLDGYADGKLTLKSVKLFLDGALGSWGAAMFEPYADQANSTGLVQIEPDAFTELVWEWVRNGWQVCSHAIGDRANNMALNAYEEAGRRAAAANFNASSLRLRVEHAQLIRPEDIARFGPLRVIPSMQPTHCTSDMPYVEQRLGKERARAEGYRWRSLLDAGAPALALGSDAPVEDVNPFLGIYAAITRKDLSGRSPHGDVGFNADETLSREQAVKGFTTWAAYAAFQENTSGSISPGKWGDLVVIDRDIFEVDERDIPDTKVLATVIGGQTVYSASGILARDSK
ncbi:amidohydrolase 3 [Hyaloraphidium curvatum]|nr:amidohydrolase 3 [Hyaloraphidium curvatum]